MASNFLSRTIVLLYIISSLISGRCSAFSPKYARTHFFRPPEAEVTPTSGILLESVMILMIHTTYSISIPLSGAREAGKSAKIFAVAFIVMSLSLVHSAPAFTEDSTEQLPVPVPSSSSTSTTLSLSSIASWDVYRRLDRIEETMFTKTDAQKMSKESREYAEKMSKESREYTEKMSKESREYTEKMSKESKEYTEKMAKESRAYTEKYTERMVTKQMFFALFLAGISQVLPVKQYLDSSKKGP